MTEAGRWLRLLINVTEYLLMFFVIIECNSFFIHSVDNGGSDTGDIITYIAVFFAALLFALYLFTSSRRIRMEFCRFVFIPVLLEIPVLLFYVLNVRHLNYWPMQRGYLYDFAAFIPLMICVFYLARKRGNAFSLFDKHADLVFGLAVINLVLYGLVTFAPQLVYSDIVKTRWTGTGWIGIFRNFYNLCNVGQAGIRDVFGFKVYRNVAFFVEPLMYGVPLLTALYTELFLRAGHLRRFRAAILSIAVLTSFSTLSIMLMVVAWGLYGMKSMKEKNRLRWGILIAAIVAVGLCWLLWRKVQLGTTKTSSLMVHLEDYWLCFRAFLEKPLTGGGYYQTSLIENFMSQERLTGNRGLSNTIGLVLAEGGILLGGICMLPFMICFLQARKKENRGVALWNVGMFGLYVLTVLIFRLHLLLLIAFGYSLLEVRKSPNTGRWRIFWVCDDVRVKSPETEDSLLVGGKKTAETGRKGKTAKEHILRKTIVVLVGAVLISLSARHLLKYAYIFLQKYQITIGQSQWKTITAMIAVILWAAVILTILRDREDWGKWEVGCLFLGGAAGSVLFFLSYTWLYSCMHTYLMRRGLWGDALESGILFGIYLAGTGVISYGLLSVKRGWRGRTGAAAAVLLSIVSVMFLYGKADRYLQQNVSMIEADRDKLEEVVDAASGDVYANTDSALYHALNSGISLCPSKDHGFCVYQNASVLFPVGTDIKALFDNGYQMTKLSDQSLLYSKDTKMIETLSEKGYEFYRYYPYSTAVDLVYEAAVNELEVTSEGGVLLKGEGQSIQKGPSHRLDKGEYTIAFELHTEDRKTAKAAKTGSGQPVCRLEASIYNGKTKVASKEVLDSDFDEQGNAVIEVPFKVEDCEGVDYQVYALGTAGLEVKGIEVAETPTYITTTEYNGTGLPVREAYYETDGRLHYMREGYACVRKEYDRVGLPVSIRYEDGEGNGVITSIGYAEIHYEYDTVRGNKTRETYYDEAGRRMRLWSGASSVSWTYNRNSCPIEQRFFDTQDEPVTLSDGYSIIRREYNNQNALLEEAYFDTEGHPVLCAQGFAKVHKEYDEKNRLIQERYYDTEEKPVYIASGCAGIDRTYDENDNMIEQRLCDEEGELINGTDRYAALVREYDSLRRVTAERYEDRNGNPAVLARGYHSFTREYDDSGNITWQWFFDADGAKVVLTDGYAGIHQIYNDKKQIIREEYYGEDGNLILLPKGYAAVEREYDQAGNMTVQRFYDLEDKPVIITDGYWKQVRDFNERRQSIHEEYYDTRNQPADLPQNWSIVEKEYNEAGDEVVTRFLDASGDPVLRTEGYSEISRTYNERHQIVREEYNGTDGNLILMPKGYAATEREYDPVGNMTVQRFYDLEDKPVMITDGYWKQVREFNERRQVVREEYYDTRGRLTMTEAGYAIVEREYDRNGVASEPVYYDADGARIELDQSA